MVISIGVGDCIPIDLSYRTSERLTDTVSLRSLQVAPREPHWLTPSLAQGQGNLSTRSQVDGGCHSPPSRHPGGPAGLSSPSFRIGTPVPHLMGGTTSRIFG